MLLRREQIRWEQIDPRITAKVGAYIAQTRSSDASVTEPQTTRRHIEPTSGVQARNLPSERLEPAWTILSFFAALFVVFLYLNACLNLMNPIATTMLSALPVGLVGISTMAGIVEGGRGTSGTRLRGRVAPLDAHLRQAFARTATTRAEQLYSDVVVLLALPPTPETASLMGRRDYSLRHDLLKQCNALLTDHFRLAVHRQHVLHLIDNGNALAQAEREEQRLRTRRDAESDPVARRSYSESLDLCRERVEAVRGLAPILTRLEAHDELICQALSLAQTALTRAQTAPVALQSPDVEGLRATVRRVLNQTRAVEEAVAELNEHVP
jgi:hypothetical protein